MNAGEQKLLELQDPKFVLLDEPFTGVDPVAKHQRCGSPKIKNIGILITDHNVQETLAITDKTYLRLKEDQKQDQKTSTR